MKTEQEQIKAIKQIIDERVETTLGQVQGRHDNVIKTVDTVIIARDIVEAGYGDVKQAQIDVLNKIKNCREATDSDCYPYIERIVNKLIKEVQNDNSKSN